MKHLTFILLMFFLGIPEISLSQVESIPFDTLHWDTRRAQIGEFLGRKALSGSAFLTGHDFKDGIIEVDMAVKDGRSYPGIIFRAKDSENYERFYIRPHRSRIYEDALQYEACFNGIDSWQLYNGPGKTANAEFPYNAWFPVRLEVFGSQARVYINDAIEPNLVITDLQHGVNSGGLGLMGPTDGSAWFSNFRIIRDTTPVMPDPPVRKNQHGYITDWQLSQVMKVADVDIEQTPESQGFLINWEKAVSQPSGMVDISRYHGRLGADPDCIWARTTIYSDRHEEKLFAFGYSDFITIFCNGKLLFQGTSSYRSRDPSFLGIVGLFDNIVLPLKKGENELLINVTEVFGGWGFTFRDAQAIYLADSVSEEWESHGGFRMPEAVVYDPKLDQLYVSNYYNNGIEFISRVAPSGKTVEMEWVKGVVRPTGMVMYKNHLFVVDRTGIKEIDPEQGEIINQIQVRGAAMLNDIAIDTGGTIYLTDSRANAIIKISGNTSEVIMQGKGLVQPNGLAIRGSLLFVGNSGDGCLFTIDLTTNEITKVTCLEEGSIIDGLTFDAKGRLLISDYNGRLLRYSPGGEVKELVNMDSQGRFFADFGFIEALGLVVIPTYSDNRLVAFKLLD